MSFDSGFDALFADVDREMGRAFGVAGHCVAVGGASFDADVVIDRGVASVGANGEVSHDQIHIDVPERPFKLGEGAEIRTAGGSYRVVRPVSSDGLMATYLVVPAKVKGW